MPSYYMLCWYTVLAVHEAAAASGHDKCSTQKGHTCMHGTLLDRRDTQKDILSCSRMQRRTRRYVGPRILYPAAPGQLQYRWAHVPRGHRFSAPPAGAGPALGVPPAGFRAAPSAAVPPAGAAGLAVPAVARTLIPAGAGCPLPASVDDLRGSKGSSHHTDAWWCPLPASVALQQRMQCCLAHTGEDLPWGRLPKVLRGGQSGFVTQAAMQAQ